MNAKILKERLTEENIIKLLSFLGANRYEDKIEYLIFPTLCHNIDIDNASMKLYYYKKNQLFHCYTECGESFDIYGLFKRYYELNQQIYNFYDDIYYKIISLINFNEDIFNNCSERYNSKRDKYKKNNKIFTLPQFDPRILSVYNKIYPKEWLFENISKEAMDKYNILYSISENKIIIPHYDINDNLIGIRGRQLNVEKNTPKYMPVKIEGKIYSHPLSLNLYGLNLNQYFISKNNKVILFEGEKSCLKYSGYFEEDISVAVCGSNFNKYQLELILRYCYPKEIIIAFDKEYKKAYCDDGEKYYNKLYNICKKYNKYSNFSFIYDKEDLLNYKDSPVDKGRDIFIQLIKEREKVK